MYLRARHLTFSFPRRTRGDTLKVINGLGLHIIIIKYIIIQKRPASHITHVVTDHCYTHTHTHIHVHYNIIADGYFYIMHTIPYYITGKYNYYPYKHRDNRREDGLIYIYS